MRTIIRLTLLFVILAVAGALSWSQGLGLGSILVIAAVLAGIGCYRILHVPVPDGSRRRGGS